MFTTRRARLSPSATAGPATRTDHTSAGSVVPAGAVLDTWSHCAWSNGVQIDALQDLDVLAVRTRNTVYEITVVAPAAGEVIVRGGRYFPEPTRVYLAGSSLGGSFLKRHGIYVGFRMELHHDRQATVTTAVRSVRRLAQHRTQ